MDDRCSGRGRRDHRLGRRSLIRWAWALLGLAPLGCGDDQSTASGTDGGSESTSTTSAGSVGTVGSTGSTSSVDSTSTESATSTAETSSTAGSSTGSGPTEPLCDELDFALVVDRQAPVYGPQNRAALAGFFDAVVAQTGARVRIYPNGGVATTPDWSCDFGSDGLAGGDTVIWGDDFAVDPESVSRLDCILDGTKNVPSGSDADGDYLFTGLMFPILDQPDWPSPEASVTFAMLIGEADDDENNMYARPGMASEAFIRLAGGGDRRRVGAYTIGRNADQLHTFSVSLNEHGRHYDHEDTPFADSLTAWLPQVVTQCETHDRPVPPPQAAGCQYIDILFVIDGSLSMAEEQAALRDGTFVAFADALQSELAELQDFRVGVVSSQPGDFVLHTHRDMPATPPSPETDCGLPDGQPWIEGPSPELAAQFDCLAATEQSDILEYTAHNAALALTDSTNEGFVRNDSIVFVVMVTDEDTQQYAVSRMEIRNLLLEAVGGDLSRLVVLGIAGDQGVFEMPKTTCDGPYGTATPGRRLSSIVFSLREQGRIEDICTGDLQGAFEAALPTLVATCEAFDG